MYTPFAHAIPYAITKTPYAFFAKITLCMYLLYDFVYDFGLSRIKIIGIQKSIEEKSVKKCIERLKY